MINLSPGSEARKNLNKEFQQDKHSEFRKWFFQKYSTEKCAEFRDNFYTTLSNTGEITTFIPWFINNFIQTMKMQINTLQLRQWKSVQGEEIESPFPPDKAIALSSSVEAAPFACTTLYSNNIQKIDSAQITIKELNNIIKSQNYTNTFLSTKGAGAGRSGSGKRERRRKCVST